MTMPDQMAGAGKIMSSSLLIRAISWSLLAVLAAFLINNVLELSLGVETNLRFDNPTPVIVYLILIAVAVSYALRTRQRSLRMDADKIHKFNVYLVRSLFWGIFLVGVADVVVAFMRVEDFADVFFLSLIHI